MTEIMKEENKISVTDAGGKSPWMCDGCPYDNDNTPPMGLACLRCREVAHVLEKFQKESA